MSIFKNLFAEKPALPNKVQPLGERDIVWPSQKWAHKGSLRAILIAAVKDPETFISKNFFDREIEPDLVTDGCEFRTIRHLLNLENWGFYPDLVLSEEIKAFAKGVLRGDKIRQVSKRLDITTTWDMWGIYFGYPDCCRKAFKKQELGENSPLDGTGYRPCKECVKKYSKQELINNINKNRLCSTPFPNSGDVSRERMAHIVRDSLAERRI